MTTGGVTAGQPLGQMRRIIAIVGLCLLFVPYALELLFGGELVYGDIVPFPPSWGGVFVSLVLGLMGPCVALLTLRTRYTKALPTAYRRALHATLFGLLGVAVALFLMTLWLSVAGIF